jgi:3-deoxy-D-manno-octulosonate 8-phosphate phosphatase (KDO 8-P phosphatase)
MSASTSMPDSGPVLNFPPELLLRAQGVKVAFFDVDGVLTDGGLYFSEYPDGHERAVTLGGFRSAGEIIKRFNTLDGHGLKLLQQAGITPAVITGRDSAVLRADQDMAVAQAQFARYAGFYQGDAVATQPHFAQGATA